MSDATGDESDIVFLCRTQYPWHWNDRSEWSQETVSAHNVTVNIARAAADEIERLQSRLDRSEKEIKDLRARLEEQQVNWEKDLDAELTSLRSRLGTVEQLLRDTMRPHGSCTEGSCTHCDATSALADMARALVGEKRPHIDIPAPDCPCTGCEVLRRDAAVENQETKSEQHVHTYRKSFLIPGELCCPCGHYIRESE